MIAVVIAANLVSLISVGPPTAAPGVDGAPGLPGIQPASLVLRLAGRHLSTAATDARQGWTWSGYENMTSTTIAALPIVDDIDGMSVGVSLCDHVEHSTYTAKQCCLLRCRQTSGIL